MQLKKGLIKVKPSKYALTCWQNWNPCQEQCSTCRCYMLRTWKWPKNHSVCETALFLNQNSKVHPIVWRRQSHEILDNANLREVQKNCTSSLQFNCLVWKIPRKKQISQQAKYRRRKSLSQRLEFLSRKQYFHNNLFKSELVTVLTWSVLFSCFDLQERRQWKPSILHSRHLLFFISFSIIWNQTEFVILFTSQFFPQTW